MAPEVRWDTTYGVAGHSIDTALRALIDGHDVEVNEARDWLSKLVDGRAQGGEAAVLEADEDGRPITRGDIRAVAGPVLESGDDDELNPDT